MKKNRFFVLGVLVAALILGMVFTGCGGGDPKALAKQTYDIGQQALGAVFNPAKAAELTKKAADIEQKVAKLSQADQAIYQEELARLAGKGLGDLFNAAGAALDSVNTEDAANALKQAGGLLDTASKLSDDPSVQDAQKALDTAKDAADAAQQAAGALKSLGF